MNVSSHICKNPFSENSHQLFHFFSEIPSKSVSSVQLRIEALLFTWRIKQKSLVLIFTLIELLSLSVLHREKKNNRSTQTKKVQKIINYFKVSFIHLFIHYIFLFSLEKKFPFQNPTMLTWIYENMLVNNQEDVVPKCWMERLWAELS